MHNDTNRKKSNSARISLKLEEMEALSSLIKADHSNLSDPLILSILMKVDTVLSKIQIGSRKSDYIPVERDPKQSIEASLGMLPNNSVAYTLDDIMYHTKESYWEACYALHIKDVTRLSLQEIQAAREYMYLNDLMTDTEMKEFEQETTTT